MCGQGILCYINFRIVLCGDYYLSGYFRWSDPFGDEMRALSNVTYAKGDYEKEMG